MKTLLEVLKLSQNYLQEKKVDHSRRFAEEIIADALELTRVQLYMDYDRPLSEDELKKCRERLIRCGKGEPPAYIRGLADFYGCRFTITKDVLIPRQETEIFVDKCVSRLRNRTQEKNLWDVCCGSGCVGLSLKKTFPELSVQLGDISKAALNIARQNASDLGFEVSFVEGDLFAPFQGKADFILCNPPYISAAEYEGLDPSVKHFEPRQALVGGPSGLEFYERIAKDLQRVINPGGLLACELGTGQGDAVKQIFQAQGFFSGLVEKDWAGHDRFFFIDIE